jgi:hypothetical protein
VRRSAMATGAAQNRGNGGGASTDLRGADATVPGTHRGAAEKGQGRTAELTGVLWTAVGRRIARAAAGGGQRFGCSRGRVLRPQVAAPEQGA